MKTIISGQPFLTHEYNLSLPDNYANDMCFQILGFDILLDAKLEPHLLEVNHTPSFVTETPLDHHIKYSLIQDTIMLMNVSLENKKEKVLNRQQFTKDREGGKFKKPTAEGKMALRLEEHNRRNRYEDSHLGNYEKIYPTEDKTLTGVYIDLLNVSNTLFRRENIGWKDKTLPSFKKSQSMTQTLIRKSPTKELPPLKTLRSEDSPSREPMKILHKYSIEMIKEEVKKTNQVIFPYGSLTLRKRQKSMSMFQE